MARKGASITQADVARIIRAARQEGVAAVELKLNGDGEATIVLRLVNTDAAEPKKSLEQNPDFVL